jgi:hypothetical protein
LLRHAPEIRYSPRVVTGKMATEKLKNLPHGSRIKPGPAHKLKTIKPAMSSHCSDHRHNT